MNSNKLALLAGTALSVALGLAQTANAQSLGGAPWTGFYVGGNFGLGFGQVDATAAVSPYACPFTLFQLNAAGCAPVPGGTNSAALKPGGLIGGVQAGHN